jgi:hypothetical protein
VRHLEPSNFNWSLLHNLNSCASPNASVIYTRLTEKGEKIQSAVSLLIYQPENLPQGNVHNHDIIQETSSDLKAKIRTA